jgi:hypothetical protein
LCNNKGVAGNCRHQQNSSTSKILWLVEQKAEPEKFGNLATHAKIGWTKEKGKAPRCSKQEFATNAIWHQDSKF